MTISKGYKIIESSVFSCAADIRLQCFREISLWLTDKWFPHLKKLPVNCDDPSRVNASSNDTRKHATIFDCDLDACEESTCHFLDDK